MFSRGPSRLWLVLVSVLLVPLGSGTAAVSGRVPIAAVAVFPVQNLGVGNVPGAEFQQFLTDQFAAAGVRVLPNDALEAFIERHRVRYSAGIDATTAERLRQETGVDGAVFPSIEFWNDTPPPRVALFVRLVSIVDTPVVVWSADAGRAGDDEPGLFDLGLISDPQALLKRVFDRISRSLAIYLETGGSEAVKLASRFEPKSYHRSLTLDSGPPRSVAVVPFFNLSPRTTAGEIMALHFMRHLSRLPQFRVVEAGVVRQQLLDARIIMDSGLSISDAETVAARIEADYVLAGRVIRYDDGTGAGARVEFSTALIERKTRRVVWSSDSYNDGAESAGLFERGILRTAHAMADQMVGLTAELMVDRRR